MADYRIKDLTPFSGAYPSTATIELDNGAAEGYGQSATITQLMGTSAVPVPVINAKKVVVASGGDGTELGSIVYSPVGLNGRYVGANINGQILLDFDAKDAITALATPSKDLVLGARNTQAASINGLQINLWMNNAKKRLVAFYKPTFAGAAVTQTLAAEDTDASFTSITTTASAKLAKTNLLLTNATAADTIDNSSIEFYEENGRPMLRFCDAAGNYTNAIANYKDSDVGAFLSSSDLTKTITKASLSQIDADIFAATNFKVGAVSNAAAAGHLDYSSNKFRGYNGTAWQDFAMQGAPASFSNVVLDATTSTTNGALWYAANEFVGRKNGNNVNIITQNSSPSFGTVTASGDISTSAWYTISTDSRGTIYDIGANKRTAIMKVSGAQMCLATNNSSTTFIKIGYWNNADITAATTFTSVLDINPVNGTFSPVTSNSCSIGGATRLFANGYFTTLTATTVVLGASTSTTAGAIRYSGGTFQGYNGTTWVGLGADGTYTDAQARAAIATNTASLVGVGTGQLADASFTQTKQLSFYYDETTSTVKAKYRDSNATATFRFNAFANAGAPAAFTTLAAGYSNELANVAAFQVNPVPAGSEKQSLDLTVIPAIMSLPASDPNISVGFVSEPIVSQIYPIRTALSLVRRGTNNVNDANFACFDVGTYAATLRSDQTFQTSTRLGIYLSNNLQTESAATRKYQVLFDSSGYTGFSATPKALITIGNGDTTGGLTKNQLAFADTTNAHMHFISSRHSTSTQAGNSLVYYVYDYTTSGTEGPGLTTKTVFQMSGDYCAPYVDLIPATTNTVALGRTAFKWKEVWALNGTIQTSDTALKRDITTNIMGSMSTQFASLLSAIDGMDVIRYKMEGNDYDSIGFDARQLYDMRMPGSYAMLLDDEESTKLKFGEYELLSDADKAKTSFGINIADIVGLHHAGIKELLARVKELEQRIAA